MYAEMLHREYNEMAAYPQHSLGVDEYGNFTRWRGGWPNKDTPKMTAEAVIEKFDTALRQCQEKPETTGLLVDGKENELEKIVASWQQAAERKEESRMNLALVLWRRLTYIMVYPLKSSGRLVLINRSPEGLEEFLDLLEEHLPARFSREGLELQRRS